MKFDVIVGNPPYQKRITDKKSLRLWDKFLLQDFSLLKDGGHLCIVHPGGWKNITGRLTKIRDLLLSKQIHYLEIHDENDSEVVFGVQSTYDWYVLENTKPYKNTILKDHQGKINNIDLSDKKFIPNFNIQLNYSMISNKDNIEILADCSYFTLHDHVSETETDIYKYPIVYTVNKTTPIFHYSSKNDKHFGIPKLIFNPARPVSFLMDRNGEYGLSQFCVGIIGDDDYLKTVENVFRNQKKNGFSSFMESTHFTTKVFNVDVFSKFNKNLWCYFNEKA
jgi:hypothetical protein